MIPDTQERRLQALRQKLAVNADIAELLNAVASDFTTQLYARTHGVVDSHPLLSHTLGEAKGVDIFIKSITAAPTAGKSSR